MRSTFTPDKAGALDALALACSSCPQSRFLGERRTRGMASVRMCSLGVPATELGAAARAEGTLARGRRRGRRPEKAVGSGRRGRQAVFVSAHARFDRQPISTPPPPPRLLSLLPHPPPISPPPAPRRSLRSSVPRPRITRASPHATSYHPVLARLPPPRSPPIYPISHPSLA